MRTGGTRDETRQMTLDREMGLYHEMSYLSRSQAEYLYYVQ